MSRLVLAVVVGLLASVLGGAPTQALAAPVIVAGAGSGSGQVERPMGVAVDQSTGSLVVSDEKNERVDLFGSTGVFQLAFGFGVLDGANQLETCSVTCGAGLLGAAPGQLAGLRSVGVDDASGDVYVANAGVHRVEKFDATGKWLLMFGRNVDRGPHHPGDLCTAEYIAAGDTCGGESVGTGPGEFGSGHLPLAVDASGNVWVGDMDRVEEFNAKGEYLSEVVLPGVGEVRSLAMDAAGDFYAIAAAYHGVRKYSPGGVLLYSLMESEEEFANSVVIDQSRSQVVAGGQVVNNGRPYVFSAFDIGKGVKLKQWGAGEVIGTPGANGVTFTEGNGIAIDEGAGRLFTASAKSGEESAVQEFSFPVPGPLFRAGSVVASPVGGTTATLSAPLDPEGKETHYRFEYVDNATYETDVSEHGAGHGFDHATVLGEQSLPADFGEHPISAALSSLRGETEYHFRVVATSECEAGKQCSTVEASTFVTLPPVQVDSLYVENVSGDSAELGAAIDPLGTSSAYRFEYVSETAYRAGLQAGGSGFEETVKIPVPDAPLGSGSEDVTVAQTVHGLSAGMTYRYRVGAHNIGGERFSAIGTFVTQSTGASGLPDGRSWEMVSPAVKHGALISGIFEPGVVQAAAAGDAITYIASVPTESSPAGFGNQVQVLSTRGAAGWGSRDIVLPEQAPGGAGPGKGSEYRFFSEDLSSAIVQEWGAFDPRLSPQASEATPFLRTDYRHGNVEDPCEPSSMECYRPLVSGCPPAGTPCAPQIEEHADVPPGTVFG